MEEIIYLLIALILWPVFAYLTLKYGFGYEQGQEVEGFELFLGGMGGFVLALVFPLSLIILAMAAFLRWTFHPHKRPGVDS